MKQPIILLIACGLLVTAPALAVAGTIAKVDGIEVSDEMFDAFAVSRTRKPTAELSTEDRANLSEELFKLVAVGAEARKRKLDNDPEVSAQIKLQELSLLAQTFIQRQLTENPVSEDRIKALYEQKYGGSPKKEYKARHILVSSPTKASEIIDNLATGRDFAELAAEYSIGPSAKSGGELGWFTEESMVPAFANAVAAMESGTHSSTAVQTQFGWHVILKEQERDLPKPELAAVGAELQRELQQQTVTELVDALRAKAKVKTYQ